MHTMTNPDVQSGITGVGGLNWGAHFCQFYRTSEDLADSLVPYFAAGLGANEQCLWVTAEPLTAGRARASLARAVPGAAEMEASGQIEILDYTEWYERAGTLSMEQVLGGWVEREERARARGFAGLRLTGNTFWLERKDWESFVHYE